MGQLVIAEQPERHRCELPEERVWPPRWVDTLPAGSRYFCDCGQVWIVRWVGSHDVGMHRVVGHYEWCHESRREARERLGLRWWQRLPSVHYDTGAELPQPRRPDPGVTETGHRPPPPRGPSGISPGPDGSR